MVTVNEKVSFTDYASGTWLLYFSRYWENDNDITFCHHDVIIIFWHCFVSLSNFSYCSKFHANIIKDSGVITIYFYKGLTRNRETGNTLVWVLLNIWRLRQVRDTKFGTDVPNELLLNATKCQCYKKPTPSKVPPPPPAPRLNG